jgi:hypothetical protein
MAEIYYLVTIIAVFSAIQSIYGFGILLFGTPTDQGLINNLIGYSEINPYDKPSDADFGVNTDNNTLLNDSKQSLLGFVKSITI